MGFLKKMVSLTHQMAPPFYHTRAIRASTSPRNQVSAASVTRQYHNKVNPGPLRQLYHARARSFSPLICAFGLVSGGSIFKQLQIFLGPSRNEFFKPLTTTKEQEFWNSIMIYLKKFLHLTHVVVHHLYQTRVIRPSRSLAICAFGLISGIIFRQLRKFHATVRSEKAYMAGITAVEPQFPIFCELRLYVNHNPTGYRSVEVYVHGLWMCYYDNGVLYHLINKYPTPADVKRGEQELDELDDFTQFELMFKWPSFCKLEYYFWLQEFVKHALTSVGVYRDKYFRDVWSLSGPYIGGEKDIAKFLESNYRAGVQYDASKFRGELSNHVGADVQIIGSNVLPWHLQEIGILFTRDGMVLVNHPKASLSDGNDIIVRRYDGKSV